MKKKDPWATPPKKHECIDVVLERMQTLPGFIAGPALILAGLRLWRRDPLAQKIIGMLPPVPPMFQKHMDRIGTPFPLLGTNKPAASIPDKGTPLKRKKRTGRKLQKGRPVA